MIWACEKEIVQMFAGTRNIGKIIITMLVMNGSNFGNSMTSLQGVDH